jgi:hypothetical protein
MPRKELIRETFGATDSLQASPGKNHPLLAIQERANKAPKARPIPAWAEGLGKEADKLGEG